MGTNADVLEEAPAQSLPDNLRILLAYDLDRIKPSRGGCDDTAADGVA